MKKALLILLLTSISLTILYADNLDPVGPAYVSVYGTVLQTTYPIPIGDPIPTIPMADEKVTIKVFYGAILGSSWDYYTDDNGEYYVYRFLDSFTSFNKGAYATVTVRGQTKTVELVTPTQHDFLFPIIPVDVD